MKTNLLVSLGLLILLSVIATAIGIWHMSETAEFKRKEAAAPAAISPPAAP